MPWQSWINAEIYDRFVRERPIYGWLNRRLVQLAEVAEARRVLDLGCGTGATALACLGKIGARAEIVGIDSSREMVRVARANVADPRARFEVLRATEVERLDGSFDRIVCNAAFWQFPDAEQVLRGLAARSGAGSRLVFNVPAQRVVGEGAPIHPFQVSLMQQIELRSGSKLEAEPVMIERTRLEADAARHGFALLRVERHVYEGRQDELIELMSIPAMIRPLTAEMTDEEREAVLDRARETSDPELAVAVPWVYFILERRPDGAPNDLGEPSDPP